MSHAWFYIPVGIPYLVSFFAIFAHTAAHTRAIDEAIAHRNRIMSHKSDNEAFDIYKKTAALDVIKANQGSPTFDQAVRGFNAEFGNDSPQGVFQGFVED